MRKLFNISGLLLAMFFVACAEFSVDELNPEQERFIVTRAATDIKGKDYYWSGGRKIYLDTDSARMIVGFDSEEELNTFASNTSEANPFQGKAMALINVRSESVKEKISVSRAVKNKIFANKYSGYDDAPFYMTGEIIMQPKDGVSVEDILTKHEVDAEEVNKTDIGIVIRLKDWSKLLSTANAIYESEMVDWCHPDFISQHERTTSDQYFSQQYYLKNTGSTGGTSGIDINVEPAWAISKGNGIRVAVIDDGVEDHDDLAGRVLNGYTPLNPASGNGRPTTQSGLPSDLIGHGQACAGIIAASHNTMYTAGVAPNVTIIPVNIFHTWQYDPYYGWYSIESVQDVASGIEYAWNPNKGNADVISNSWGSGSPPANADAITQQINNAVNQGRLRNGVRRGCVVIFSSGNSMPYQNVLYPANLPNVIAVGAVDKYGTVWNYSNRGGTLDVVAPSGDVADIYGNLAGDVYTLDRMGSNGYETGNYTWRFGGTSAAAPQVAGIAALILSQYPNLEQWKVRLAIEKSCRKLPGYHFFTNLSVYPSGSWNSDIGYGLVDAAAALAAAQFGPFVTGIDFTFTNNSSFEIDGLYVGLTGKLGNVNTTFINCDPNYVAPGSSTGLPAYPGLDILAAPGTPITDLSLQLWAYTYNTSHPEDVRISAWVEGAWQENYSYLDLDGVSSLTMPLTYSNPSVPNTGRLMLHINVTDYYYGWKSPLNGNVAPDSLKMVK